MKRVVITHNGKFLSRSVYQQIIGLVRGLGYVVVVYHGVLAVPIKLIKRGLVVVVYAFEGYVSVAEPFTVLDEIKQTVLTHDLDAVVDRIAHMIVAELLDIVLTEHYRRQYDYSYQHCDTDRRDYYISFLHKPLPRQFDYTYIIYPTAVFVNLNFCFKF